ncbi:MAG TPA: glycosyltransferase family 1 protein [Chitinophagaceae bacterium]|nr:glycosyltransferase family 1 protein [Chitinophagaceae bacterium]
MKIGFDAKRAYHNGTGLGHYSRNLIRALATYYPGNEYFLFTPSITDRFELPGDGQVHSETPHSFAAKRLPAFWRSRWVLRDMKRMQIGLYHGLSHEIPLGIRRTGIKSVVTIHDLIHERFPDQYSRADVLVYRKKFRYACTHADRTIAVSNQTRQDILDFYGISPEKVVVVYQSINPRFEQVCPPGDLERVRVKYGLPSRYLLYVGSVIRRKNLLGLCRALRHLEGSLKLPLAVIGQGRSYRKEVIDFLSTHGMQDRILWLSQGTGPDLRDFPALYQGAIALVYPSVFEGFGIPILEALWSRLPVITSTGSCFSETAGEAALYVDPGRVQDLAEAIWQVCSDEGLRSRMKEEGLRQARKFSPAIAAENLMKVYHSLDQTRV